MKAAEPISPADLSVTVREVAAHPEVWPRSWVVRAAHLPTGRAAEAYQPLAQGFERLPHRR